MSLTYFKRYRMEIDLTGRQLAAPILPAGYRMLNWDESLIEAHAETKYHSFQFEIDANVFPCLGDSEGCHRLMHEIRGKQGFLPGATWLMAYDSPGTGGPEYCGTIQGIRDYAGLGAIQNLGVTPEHRGRQLGTCLLIKAAFWKSRPKTTARFVCINGSASPRPARSTKPSRLRTLRRPGTFLTACGPGLPALRRFYLAHQERT